MKGKAKCKALKEIRRQIAEKNDIPYAVSQCTYQGDCTGTCPKCEAELKYLERELAIRKNLGKAVAITGISMGICTPLTACTPEDFLQILPGYENELQGDVIQVQPTTPPPDAEGYIEVAPEDPSSPSENEPAGEKFQNPSPETPVEDIDDGMTAGDIAPADSGTDCEIDVIGDIYIDETNQ